LRRVPLISKMAGRERSELISSVLHERSAPPQCGEERIRSRKSARIRSSPRNGRVHRRRVSVRNSPVLRLSLDGNVAVKASVLLSDWRLTILPKADVASRDEETPAEPRKNHSEPQDQSRAQDQSLGNIPDEAIRLLSQIVCLSR
jgi:hypothetical protein